FTSTPISVSVLGWMPSATHARMIARSGYMQTAPVAPVTVSRRRGVRGALPLLTAAGAEGTAEVIMEGSDTARKRAIVAYAHPRAQGADCPAAGAARSVSVLQCGWRHDLRRQGAIAARPRPQLSRRIGIRCQARRPARRDRPP